MILLRYSVALTIAITLLQKQIHLLIKKSVLEGDALNNVYAALQFSILQNHIVTRGCHVPK